MSFTELLATVALSAVTAADDEAGAAVLAHEDRDESVDGEDDDEARIDEATAAAHVSVLITEEGKVSCAMSFG